MPDDEGMALYRAGLAGRLQPVSALSSRSAPTAASRPCTSVRGRPTRGAILFSVDHHRGSEENQAGWDHHDPEVVDSRIGRMDTLPWARRTITEAGLEDDVVLVVGPSSVVASHWSTPLSLLFIDGGHGADVAWSDYRLWAPKVAVGGLLAIHDVFADPAGRRPPPLRVVLRRAGFRWLHRVGGCRLRQPAGPAPPAHALIRRPESSTSGPGVGGLGAARSSRSPTGGSATRWSCGAGGCPARSPAARRRGGRPVRRGG